MRVWRFTAGHLLSYGSSAGAIVVRGDTLSAETKPCVEARSRRWLGLDRDLTAFFRMAARDADLWPVVEPLAGLPIFCSETVFEALITLIIEQHIAWKSAQRAQRELLRISGRSLLVGETPVYDFPAPERLAQASRGRAQALEDNQQTYRSANRYCCRCG